MSDLVFETDKYKLLATKDGFMVRGHRWERWVQWDVYRREGDKDDLIDERDTRIKQLEEALREIEKHLFCAGNKLDLVENNHDNIRLELDKALGEDK